MQSCQPTVDRSVFSPYVMAPEQVPKWPFRKSTQRSLRRRAPDDSCAFANSIPSSDAAPARRSHSSTSSTGCRMIRGSTTWCSSTGMDGTASTAGTVPPYTPRNSATGKTEGPRLNGPFELGRVDERLRAWRRHARDAFPSRYARPGREGRAALPQVRWPDVGQPYLQAEPEGARLQVPRPEYERRPTSKSRGGVSSWHRLGG